MASQSGRVESPDRSYRRQESLHTNESARSASSVSMSSAEPQLMPGRSSSSRHRDDRYDSRHYNRLAASTRRSPATSRSPLRRRSVWPPQPFAEDEMVSLKREAGSWRRQRQPRHDDVPSRGSIDQEPIIVDLLKSDTVPPRPVNNTPDSSIDGGRTAFPTPPTSDDERSRKAKDKARPRRLATDLVPEMRGRDSSPYSFSRPVRISSDIVSSDRFLSPDSINFPFEMPRKAGTFPLSVSQPTSPNRDPSRSPRSRRGKDYFTSQYTIDESAIDDNDNYVRPQGHERKSSSGPRGTISGSIGNGTDSTPDRVDSRRRGDFGARRDTILEDALPPMSKLNIEKTRRPPPLTTSQSFSEPLENVVSRAASLMPAAAEQLSRSRESSYSRSRPVSPATSVTGQTVETPSRSPRMSAEFSSGGPSGTSSRPSSTHGSLPSSPQVAPAPRLASSPRTPSVDLDGKSPQTTAAPPRRSNLPPSRLAAEVFRETSPELVRKATAPLQFNSLPYPVDDEASTKYCLMPSEYEHQWRPGTGHTSWPVQPAGLDSPGRPYPQMDFTTSPPPLMESNVPSLHRAYSATATTSPTDAWLPRGSIRFAEPAPSLPTTSRRYEELKRSVAAKPPKCAQRWKVTGKNYWFTVRGSQSIHFCADCAEPMRGTVFDAALTRFEQPAGRSSVYCAFELPWMVRAWRWTLHDGRHDFQSLRALADVDRCAGAGPRKTLKTARRLMYPDGSLVAAFYLCEADFHKIRLLLPKITGIFVERPVADEHHECRIRTDTARFRDYWNALEAIHAQSKVTGGPVDPTPLIDAHQQKRQSQDGPRAAKR